MGAVTKDHLLAALTLGALKTCEDSNRATSTKLRPLASKTQSSRQNTHSRSMSKSSSLRKRSNIRVRHRVQSNLWPKWWCRNNQASIVSKSKIWTRCSDKGVLECEGCALIARRCKLMMKISDSKNGVLMRRKRTLRSMASMFTQLRLSLKQVSGKWVQPHPHKWSHWPTRSLSRQRLKALWSMEPLLTRQPRRLLFKSQGGIVV